MGLDPPQTVTNARTVRCKAQDPEENVLLEKSLSLSDPCQCRHHELWVADGHQREAVNRETWGLSSRASPMQRLRGRHTNGRRFWLG